MSLIKSLTYSVIRASRIKGRNNSLNLRGIVLSHRNYANDINDDKEVLRLSQSAINKLKRINEDDASFLRVMVEGGGCSGFQTKFDFDTKVHDDDVMVEKDGVKIVVDNDSLEFIRGSTIDYHEELIRSAFAVVNNPQAEQGCSCGVSFALKL